MKTPVPPSSWPRKQVTVACAVAFGSVGLAPCSAALVTLQNATATLSQGGWPVGMSINGSLFHADGWAIWDGGTTAGQTAVFETTSNISFPGGVKLQFSLVQNYGGGFTIGRFRLSVTTDDQSFFADGLANGGDVLANWTVLSPFASASSAGASLTQLGDGSIIAGTPPTGTDTYTVTANALLSGITGVRLELLEDASLPFAGPGYGNVGNAVLTEFTLDASPIIPEPGTVAFVTGFGLAVFGIWRRVRQ